MNALRKPPSVSGPMREVYELLVVGETRLLRFFFGLACVFYAIFVMNGAAGQFEYKLAFEVLAPVGWAGMFALSGGAIFVGSITKKFNYFSLILEGPLGFFAWLAFSILVMIQQGTIGAVTILALINLFLFVRYPTFQGEKL